MTLPERWARVAAIDDSVELPAWLAPVAEGARGMHVDDITRFAPQHGEGRAAAVLLLFGDGPDLLLVQRAKDLRAHAGQAAFPGGAMELHDAGPRDTAVREAHEETGLDVSGVRIFGQLPDLSLPVTGYVVTPVLGWWHAPCAVYPADPREVVSVHRVGVAELTDPANRCRIQHPSGYVGPAFLVQGMVVWGFTAGIIAGILDRAGWAQPWDASRIVHLEAGA
ncbi:MAG: NUDIX hydrolase [Actinomycetales bacterium]